MWGNTRMIVLTAISAAAYVAVLLPFKGLVIIPGLTEVRPGGAIPIVMGFFFGPAAAWGSAFGNLIADALGGMLTPVSAFGFLANFIYAYIPYAFWRALMGRSNPVRSGVKGWLVYGVVIVTACLSIGSVIGWGGDLLKMAPFAALGLIITVNDFIATATIGTILIGLLYERVRGMGLMVDQVLDEESVPSSGRIRLGVVFCVAGAAVAFFSGLLISGEMLGAGYGAAGFVPEATRGTMAVGAGMVPGLLLLLVGLILL